MTSDITKSYKNKYVITLILDILLEFGPVIGFCVFGFVTAEPKQKVGLVACCGVAIVLALINIVFKFHLRSVVWILAIGVYICLKDLMPFFLIIASTTIVEEFMMSPLCKHYKSKLSINREIDKRL